MKKSKFIQKIEEAHGIHFSNQKADTSESEDHSIRYQGIEAVNFNALTKTTTSANPSVASSTPKKRIYQALQDAQKTKLEELEIANTSKATRMNPKKAERVARAIVDRKEIRIPPSKKESLKEKLDRHTKTPFFLAKDGSNKFGSVLQARSSHGIEVGGQFMGSGDKQGPRNGAKPGGASILQGRQSFIYDQDVIGFGEMMKDFEKKDRQAHGNAQEKPENIDSLFLREYQKKNPNLQILLGGTAAKKKKDEEFRVSDRENLVQGYQNKMNERQRIQNIYKKSQASTLNAARRYNTPDAVHADDSQQQLTKLPGQPESILKKREEKRSRSALGLDNAKKIENSPRKKGEAAVPLLKLNLVKQSETLNSEEAIVKAYNELRQNHEKMNQSRHKSGRFFRSSKTQRALVDSIAQQLRMEKLKEIEEKNLNPQTTRGSQEQQQFSRLSPTSQKMLLRNQADELMAKSISLSNGQFYSHLKSFRQTETKGVGIYTDFQDRYLKINQMLRINNSQVMELYEDSNLGTQANSGTYKLDTLGDKAFFCFHQDIFKLVKQLRNYKDPTSGNPYTADELYQKIGCAISLSQVSGEVAIYVSDIVTKPTKINCQMHIDGRVGARQNMKVLFEPQKLDDDTDTDIDENEFAAQLKNSMLKKSKKKSKLTDVDKQIQQMVRRKSIENIQRVNKILNNMYVHSDEIQDFEEVFKAYRYVNITVEALSEHSHGKLYCFSEPLIKGQAAASSSIDFLKRSISRKLKGKNTGRAGGGQFLSSRRASIKKPLERMIQDESAAPASMLKEKKAKEPISLEKIQITSRKQQRETFKNLMEEKKELNQIQGGKKHKRDKSNPRILNNKYLEALYKQVEHERFSFKQLEKIRSKQSREGISEDKFKTLISGESYRAQNLANLNLDFTRNADKVQMFPGVPTTSSALSLIKARSRRGGDAPKSIKVDPRRQPGTARFQQQQQLDDTQLTGQTDGTSQESSVEEGAFSKWQKYEGGRSKTPALLFARDGDDNNFIDKNRYILPPGQQAIRKQFIKGIADQRRKEALIRRDYQQQAEIQLKILKSKAVQIRTTVQKELDAKIRRRLQKIYFLIFWTASSILSQILLRSSRRFNALKNLKLFNFIGYFMARRIQVKFRNSLRSWHRQTCPRLMRHTNEQIAHLHQYSNVVSVFCSMGLTMRVGTDKRAKKKLVKYLYQWSHNMKFILRVRRTMELVYLVQNRFDSNARRKERKFKIMNEFWSYIIQFCRDCKRRGDVKLIEKFQGDKLEIVSDTVKATVIQEYILDQQKRYVIQCEEYKEWFANQKDPMVRLAARAMEVFAKQSIFHRRYEIEERQAYEIVNLALRPPKPKHGSSKIIEKEEQKQPSTSRKPETGRPMLQRKKTVANLKKSRSPNRKGKALLKKIQLQSSLDQSSSARNHDETFSSGVGGRSQQTGGGTNNLALPRSLFTKQEKNHGRNISGSSELSFFDQKTGIRKSFAHMTRDQLQSKSLVEGKSSIHKSTNSFHKTGGSASLHNDTTIHPVIEENPLDKIIHKCKEEGMKAPDPEFIPSIEHFSKYLIRAVRLSESTTTFKSARVPSQFKR